MSIRCKLIEKVDPKPFLDEIVEDHYIRVRAGSSMVRADRS